MVNGVLFAMMIGTSMMPLWCVGSLVTLEPYLHLVRLPMVTAVVQFTMTMYNALGMSHAWPTALTMVLEGITANTAKMQEWYAKVRCSVCYNGHCIASK